jgi:hypothetical protein
MGKASAYIVFAFILLVSAGVYRVYFDMKLMYEVFIIQAVKEASSLKKNEETLLLR